MPDVCDVDVPGARAVVVVVVPSCGRCCCWRLSGLACWKAADSAARESGATLPVPSWITRSLAPAETLVPWLVDLEDIVVL